MTTCWRTALSVVLVLGLVAGAQAREVARSMPNGVEALASYVPGAPGKPAVLLVHGFLQTRQFHTVARLAGTLGDEGYTVLRPTLTLDVPRRKKSLSCDAVHAHRMDQDLAEVARWVEFLRERGHDRIVLFGHSYGGVQAVAAAARAPSQVIGVVGVSLADVEHSFGSRNAGDHPSDGARGSGGADGQVQVYALSYCDRYPAPPSAYRSYLRWDREKILEAVEAINVPVHAIVGGADERMGADWPGMLQGAGASVQRVPRADHFFGAMHEFDLAEEALAALAAIEDGP